MIEQVQRQEVGSKLTITEAEARSTTRSTGGIHRSRVDHAARDPDRGADRRKGGQATA